MLSCLLWMHNVNLFGHKTEGDGYYNAYRDFCCNHGIPTILACDNAQEQKSQKVTDFNRDHLVADRFSEVNNQQQNPVESGVVKWLKLTIRKMLGITGAPEWAWWLCAVYLAAIHNMTWNEEKQCIPLTA